MPSYLYVMAKWFPVERNVLVCRSHFFTVDRRRGAPAAKIGKDMHTLNLLTAILVCIVSLQVWELMSRMYLPYHLFLELASRRLFQQCPRMTRTGAFVSVWKRKEQLALGVLTRIIICAPSPLFRTIRELLLSVARSLNHYLRRLFRHCSNPSTLALPAILRDAIQFLSIQNHVFTF